MPISNYKWHPYTKRRYAFTVGAAVFVTVVWLTTRGGIEWAPRIMALFIFLVSLFLLIEQDTKVDRPADVMIREGWLFGRFLVWRRRHLLSEFTGVGFRRQHDSEGGNDTVFVGLRRRSGRLVAIRYFLVGRGQPCYEAERIGRSLSEATGLQLHEDLA
jgi:hypothetical protein